MAKIIIELDKNNKAVVTYNNDKLEYPICDVSDDNFHISETTDVLILTLVTEVIYQLAKSLTYQLIKQKFVNKPLNKPANKK